MRVFNDDVVKAGKGSASHPHKDMEIVTYVVEGELEHKDHLGNRGVVHSGEVQVMSAGKGIMHAEYKHSKERPARLMQLWIEPRSKGGSRGGSRSSSVWRSGRTTGCRWSAGGEAAS